MPDMRIESGSRQRYQGVFAPRHEDVLAEVFESREAAINKLENSVQGHGVPSKDIINAVKRHDEILSRQGAQAKADAQREVRDLYQGSGFYD